MDLPNPYLVHHLRLAPLLVPQAQRQSRGPPASHQGDQALSRHHVPTLVVPYFGAGYGREELLEQALERRGRRGRGRGRRVVSTSERIRMNGGWGGGADSTLFLLPSIQSSPSSALPPASRQPPPVTSALTPLFPGGRPPPTWIGESVPLASTTARAWVRTCNRRGGLQGGRGATIISAGGGQPTMAASPSNTGKGTQAG